MKVYRFLSRPVVLGRYSTRGYDCDYEMQHLSFQQRFFVGSQAAPIPATPLSAYVSSMTQEPTAQLVITLQSSASLSCLCSYLYLNACPSLLHSVTSFAIQPKCRLF